MQCEHGTIALWCDLHYLRNWPSFQAYSNYRHMVVAQLYLHFVVSSKTLGFVHDGYNGTRFLVTSTADNVTANQFVSSISNIPHIADMYH